MNQRLRKVIFWLHLGAGVSAGLVVAVMALTGAALAFQPQLLDRAERATRAVNLPDRGGRLGADELLRRARALPGAGAPTTLTIHADPRSAARVTAGAALVLHVDPYTGDVREAAGGRWRAAFRTLLAWHRWLGADEDGRAVGRAITGACNAAFFFLALSGLYLWWPRRWTARATRLSTWFRRGLSGRTRDWNWHNVIGFWSLPALLVVTSSGMIISYPWASNLVYRLVGERPPRSTGAATPPAVSPPAPGAIPLPFEAAVAAAQQDVPTWKTITLRLGAAGGSGRGRRGGDADRRRGPQAIAVTVKEQRAWPLFSSRQLAIDPYTARVLRSEGYQDFTPGRRIRSWLRFLHTGEALGWPGQLVAGIVSLGATVLVWTGLALAWRRLARRQARVAAAAALERALREPA
jgi:uncharacterized iron-regulated membrane protein